MKRNFCIILCGILCIITIGCSSKLKNDNENNQSEQVVEQVESLNELEDNSSEVEEDSSKDDYGDFADLTVYKDRFMQEDSITAEEKYNQIKKEFKKLNISKEQLEFNEKYLKLLSRVSDKMLSMTTEGVLITHYGNTWHFTMDTKEKNLNLYGMTLEVSNTVKTSPKRSDMKIQLALRDEIVTDEFYYILQEITDEFSKEEWQELINEAYKNVEVEIYIGEMRLRIYRLDSDLYMNVFTYKEFE